VFESFNSTDALRFGMCRSSGAFERPPGLRKAP
jgi:hypothetical protein